MAPRMHATPPLTLSDWLAHCERYVADMDSMTQYLVASGRARQARPVLDFTFTDPVAAADPGLVRVPGRWRG